MSQLMHAGKAGQASMAREVKMGETARVRSFFFFNTSWGDVWQYGRGERQTIAVWGRTCLWAIAVVSEGTCRLAHLRMPTRSRGLERKDLLSRANEHRLLGIGMRFREVESTVQPCSNCTTQDSRQQQATCTLCSQTVQLSQDIPSLNLNFFPSIADATVSAVNLHEIRIHTPGLDFEIAKQRRHWTFSHADTIYLDQLHGLRRLRTSSIFIFDSAPVSRQGLYFRWAFAEKQDWCFATGFQADFGLWTSLKRWNCATDYLFPCLWLNWQRGVNQASGMPRVWEYNRDCNHRVS